MSCPICQHAKIVAITAALASKKLPSVVRANYRLDKDAWAAHLRHLSARPELHDAAETPVDPVEPAPRYSLEERRIDEPAGEQPIDVLKVGLPYVRKSFRLAGADEDEQKRLIQTLNDAIESEQMGL